MLTRSLPLARLLAQPSFRFAEQIPLAVSQTTRVFVTTPILNRPIQGIVGLFGQLVANDQLLFFIDHQ
jgi:hypothetical protein